MEAITPQQAREYYADADPAHDFDHVLRVLALAERIGSAEGADMAILRPAALLHDIGRPEELKEGRCHAQVGAEKARCILSSWPASTVDAVAHAIAAHRYRADLEPETLEAKILFDADKLDCIGAIGVARAYVVGGLTGQRIWADVDAEYVQALRRDKSLARRNAAPEHTPVHEFSFKLAHVKDILFTTTAKKIAEERHRFMSEFFLRLEREVEGDL